MTRLFSMLVLAAALASCTSVVDDPFLRTGAVQGDWPPLAATVAPGRALAALPGLGATTVRQTGGKGGVEQAIVYPNSTDLAGENILTVSTGKSGAVKGGGGAPSRVQVEAEMRAVLSGVRMRISPVIGENAYGVFGYATGAAGKGGSCVYAWQFARNVTPHGGSQITGVGEAARIRLRFCSASMTADRIVALMQGLRIGPVSSANLETLHLAAAPDAFKPAPVARNEQVVDQKAEPAGIETVEVAPLRRAGRRVVVEDAAPETKETDQTIANAAKVPLPGEAAELATAVVEEKVSKMPAKPSFVPLPATVATAAQ